MFQRWSFLAVAVAASVSGCGEAPTAPPASTTSSTTAPAGGEKIAVVYSAEERAQIDKQKTCPVGGEALGSMGSPYKMMVGDRAVYLCCEHCKGAVEKDPQKYLAKLDAAVAPPAEAAPAATTEAPAKP